MGFTTKFKKVVSIVRFWYKDIVKFLNKIIFKKSEKRNDAKTILKNIENFYFIFLCVFLAQTLEETNTVSRIALSLDTNISVTAISIQKLTTEPNNYAKLKFDAENIANQCNILAHFTKKRAKSKKIFWRLVQ